MNFLTQGERLYKKFRTSRKYPPVLKFFLLGILSILISGLFFLKIIDSFIALDIPFKEFLFVPFVGIGFVLILIGEANRKRVGTYYITNYRIVVDRGLIGTKMDSISYTMIVNVKISQTFFEKLFGLGDLEISTARGNQEIYMAGISNPKEIENIIYNSLERHSTRYQEPRRQSYQRYRRNYRR
jgi:uncharacterized membrane protein YdbT with pleckstrin-like domain